MQLCLYRDLAIGLFKVFKTRQEGFSPKSQRDQTEQKDDLLTSWDNLSDESWSREKEIDATLRDDAAFMKVTEVYR